MLADVKLCNSSRPQAGYYSRSSTPIASWRTKSYQVFQIYSQIMSYVVLISLFIAFSMLEVLLAGPLKIVAGRSVPDPDYGIGGPLDTKYTDTYVEDQICGSHPLRNIIKKIEAIQPDVDQEALLRLLALVQLRAPKLWNSYQQMLTAYTNCRIMSAGGTYG